jgi:DNA repair protein RadC
MNTYRKLNIKEWAVEDRPREKMLAKGPRFLSDAELIAILIGSGNLDETAVELSRRILTSVGNNLADLGKKGVDYLKTFNGIGEAKAVSIIAALELGKRRKEAEVFIKMKITGSKDAAEYFQPLLGDLNHEEFWVLLLDRGNKIIDSFMVSQGGISGTVIDVRLILKSAIEKLASALILCHNHPSGTMQASDADLKITQKIKNAANLMDISVLDHIIIGQNSYLSLADEGIL